MDLRPARDFYITAKKDKGAVAAFAIDAFDVLNPVNYAGYMGNQCSPFLASRSQCSREGGFS